MLIFFKRCGLRMLAVGALTVMAAQAALAQTGQQPDSASIFTLIGENSTISTAALTDRYYTNGLSASYLSGEGQFQTVSDAVRTLLGDGAPRVSLGISQQIYTPNDTHSRFPPSRDRPYAGVLLGHFGVVQDSDSTRTSLGVQAGMTGPSAMGRPVQNGWHTVIGQRGNAGWNSQIHDEPVFAATASKVWRQSLGQLGGLETDALPAIGATLGTLRTDAQAGFTLRIGRGLANDFGAPRIRALSGGEAFHGGDRIGWYLFAALHGAAVNNDITLNGNNFRASRSVSLVPLVGDAAFGAALVTHGMRISYTQAIETQDFKHQKGGAHQFGSLDLSVRF